jgi:hypothetical protein
MGERRQARLGFEDALPFAGLGLRLDELRAIRCLLD